VPPGSSRADVIAAADATGGTVGVVETLIPAGHSAPLHVHRQEDEAFYVLEGSVDFVCGEERFRAGPGAFIYLPREIPHTFLAVDDARVTVLLLPAGLEEAFADPARFQQVSEEHGVENVGPPARARTFCP
jgi:quercetin dioxygenase-like cupin family protein